jgi:hypothetical protein
VLSADDRQGQIVYLLDVDGDDCGWTLPENSLVATGRSVARPRGWDGARFSEGDHVRALPKRDAKTRFSGSECTLIGRTKDNGCWWYTLETPNGETLGLREDELEEVQD